MTSASRLSRVNILLAVLTAGVMFCTWWLQPDYSRPNIEVLPDMKYTPAWLAFSANPNFENGRTLQRPVAGTVPRGLLPLHYQATKEDALRAGEELHNPYRVVTTEQPDTNGAPPDAADEAAGPSDEQGSPAAAAQQQQQRQSALRGGEVYNVFCVSCHGAAGAGDGPVTKRGFPPPPSMLSGKSLQMKDGQLFHMLTYGGQAGMPSFAAELSRGRRWDVINYVRDLQKSAPPPQPAQPSAEADDPAADNDGPPPSSTPASEP